MKNWNRYLTLAVIAIACCSCGCRQDKNDSGIPEVKACPLGFDTDAFRKDSTAVAPGETFSTMMTRLGMAPEQVYSLSCLCDTTFNVSKIIAGNVIEAYYKSDSLSGKLEYVVYRNSRIKSTIFKCSDSLAVWTYSRPVTRERKFSDITIKTSLWNDMIASGASPALIMNLADIFQWSVNLFTLKQGDRFRVIYNQTVCDGEVMSIDTVFFCLFNSGEHAVPAVRYKIEGQGNHYWGTNGESLKRMFLKAPLKYNRISSGFTYHRKHPITGKVKPHTGVDYAAPKGTPVYSIGNGKVTLCGWDSSGGGNRIRIKHPQGYESCYMHLSKFASGIRSGSIVTQGQLIGYVGSTGRSTGPHLDFRIWLKGKPLNPLTLDSPAAEPLPRKHLDDFNAVYARYMAETDSLSVKK